MRSAEVRLDAAAGRIAGFRVVDDHQIGALGADQHAADRGVEPAGGDDGPAAQRRLAGAQPRVPMVRDADGRQDDVILRPLEERPLAVGRPRGSPLGGSVQGQDRVAGFGVVVGQGLVTFELDVGRVGQAALDVGWLADLDILEGRPELAFAQGVGHADAGLLVLAGQGGDLLDLPLQVGDRLLAFLDFGVKEVSCKGGGRTEP